MNYAKEMEPTPLDAFARSLLEITPMHLRSPSTTGSPETSSKWWSMSSRVCAGVAARIDVDMTSSNGIDGPIICDEEMVSQSVLHISVELREKGKETFVLRLSSLVWDSR